MIEQDIQFIKSILPEHYQVKESKKAGSVNCKSSIGIRKGVDSEDEEHWSYIVKSMRGYFGNRLQEVYHNTCFCHVDFTVYLNSRYQGMFVDDDGQFVERYGPYTSKTKNV